MIPPAVRIWEKIRQPCCLYLKPPRHIAMPKAMPIDTRPSSPIQRLSNAYFRKKAVAKRISNTATQPAQRRPMIDSSWYALSVGATVGGGGGVTGSGSGTGAGGASNSGLAALGNIE